MGVGAVSIDLPLVKCKYGGDKNSPIFWLIDLHKLFNSVAGAVLKNLKYRKTVGQPGPHPGPCQGSLQHCCRPLAGGQGARYPHLKNPTYASALANPSLIILHFHLPSSTTGSDPKHVVYT